MTGTSPLSLPAFLRSVLEGDGGETLVVRRVTVELVEPTRKGDTESHLLRNVPADDADGCTLAQLDRDRWEIENAFHVLTMTLNCEMPANCYPHCALFQCCMALFADNCRQVLLAELYAEHEQDEVEAMSQYQVALDIVSPMEGTLTAATDDEWSDLVPRRGDGVAKFLRDVSRHVDVRSDRKCGRGPNPPQKKRKRCKTGTRISTHRLLENRTQRC